MIRNDSTGFTPIPSALRYFGWLGTAQFCFLWFTTTQCDLFVIQRGLLFGSVQLGSRWFTAIQNVSMQYHGIHFDSLSFTRIYCFCTMGCNSLQVTSVMHYDSNWLPQFTAIHCDSLWFYGIQCDLQRFTVIHRDLPIFSCDSLGFTAIYQHVSRILIILCYLIGSYVIQHHILRFSLIYHPLQFIRNLWFNLVHRLIQLHFYQHPAFFAVRYDPQ